jgi:hypothetical protein
MTSDKSQSRKKKTVSSFDEENYYLSLKVDPEIWSHIDKKTQREIKQALAGIDDLVYTSMQETNVFPLEHAFESLPLVKQIATQNVETNAESSPETNAESSPETNAETDTEPSPKTTKKRLKQ